MPEKYANDAASTLNAGINNSVTSLVVVSAATFPALPSFRIRIDDEAMLVTAVAGTTFTVTRAIEGTAAASHSTAAAVYHVLTAGALTGVGGWTEIIKASDETVTGSTTLQDDNELFFTTESGVFYEVELDIIYACPVGGATPDIIVAFGEDSTATRGVIQGRGYSNGDVQQNVQALTDNTTSNINFGGAATKRIVRFSGWILGNGGTFKFRWAQRINNQATIVYANSRLRYRSMAS